MSKAYPTYKDSGIEWLGQIPTHWDLLRNKIFITEHDNVVGQDAYKYTLLSLTKQGVIQRDIESGKGKFPKEFHQCPLKNHKSSLKILKIRFLQR